MGASITIKGGDDIRYTKASYAYQPRLDVSVVVVGRGCMLVYSSMANI